MDLTYTFVRRRFVDFQFAPSREFLDDDLSGAQRPCFGSVGRSLMSIAPIEHVPHSRIPGALSAVGIAINTDGFHFDRCFEISLEVVLRSRQTNRSNGRPGQSGLMTTQSYPADYSRGRDDSERTSEAVKRSAFMRLARLVPLRLCTLECRRRRLGKLLRQRSRLAGISSRDYFTVRQILSPKYIE